MKMIKETVFVCSVIKNGELISKTITASSLDEVKKIFETEYSIEPKNISGPFYYRKSNVIKKNTEIKFQPGNSKKAVYKGWRITAMPLETPPNSAFIFFDQRIDGQKMPKPDTTIINIEELEENEIA